jgi:hypothetical protein
MSVPTDTLSVGFVHFFWRLTCWKLFVLLSSDDTTALWHRNYQIIGSILASYLNKGWSGSSVGIATGYGLDGPGIEKKNPGGARFFAHFQTSLGSHPASRTMGTGSFPGVKRPGRGAEHPPHPISEVDNEESYTSTPLWALGVLL